MGTQSTAAGPCDANRRGGRRVLLVGVGSISELAVVRGLRAAGYEPWLASWRRRSLAAASSALAGSILLPDVSEDYEATCSAIVHACEEVRPAVVIPGNEAALVAIGDIDRFPEGVVRGAPPLPTTLRATDKLAVNEAAERVGLQMPETIIVEPAGPIPPELVYPVVVKPHRSERFSSRHSFEHRSPVRVDTVEDLQAVVQERAEIALIQPYLEGALRTVNGVFWNGQLIVSVHKVGVRTWPVDCGPLSTATTVERDPDLDQLVSDLLSDLSWCGMFNIQFLQINQDLLLIDLNPRPYLTLGLAVTSGANLPATWVDLLLGGTPPHDAGYAVGSTWRHARHDALALMASVRSPQRRSSGVDLRRAGTVHAIASWDDPKPLGRAATIFASKVLSRGSGTIRQMFRSG